MTLYRYHIHPLSAFATPLRSDTLYGHLLWRAAERLGATRVSELIAEFNSTSPPFRLSSAFPADCLPMPCLPPMPRSHFRQQFAAGGGQELIDALQDYKTFRKLPFIRRSALQQQAKSLSQATLFKAWRKDQKAVAPVEQFSRSDDQPHNSIDRASGKVLSQGGLHFGRATWYRPGTELDLYVECDNPELFEALMTDLQHSGYGADASTGKGQFRFERDPHFAASDWPASGNAQLLLSLTSAENMAEFAGYYQPQIKRGRAWSGFGEKNPFKKPFLALGEGAVLTAMPDSGFVLHHLHSNPELVQVLWPVTLPLQLEAAS